MGSSFQYNVDRAFKVIDAMQQNIIRNAQGLLQPGYNKRVLHFGQTPGSVADDGLVANNTYGSKDSQYGGGDTLAITGSTISFEQGTIEPAFSPTSLAIRGEGFFVLAENLRPGAKLYLSRAGDFHYDPQGHLVNPNGLIVVGGNGKLTDPVIPIKDPGDGTVDLPEVTLGRVQVPSQLAISGYGSTIYQLTDTAGPLKAFANGRAEVGFVQASSIEIPNRAGVAAELEHETTIATQTYKIFKDMLDNFNKTDDDAISLVK
jgi:flagellar basal body rod protein FlgG